MRMLILAAGAAALLSGCDVSTETHSSGSFSVREDGGGDFRTVARLECPERRGDLRLVSSDSQGRSCMYRTKDGSEAELRLVSLEGTTSDAFLKTLEQELQPLVPAAVQDAAEAEAEAEEAAATAEAAVAAAEEEARVSIPGVMNIEAKGDRAKIRLPGVTIDADDDRADIRVADKDGQNVTVHARDEAAEIRASSSKGGVRSTYLLASDEAGPAGWKLAGYEARGPANGPLVVGVVRGRGRHGDEAFDDLKKLVKRNAGG